jgi:uncharacterized membrane protein
MIRYTALAVGCFYTLVGTLGLIPPLHENWPDGEPMMAVRNGRGFLFGAFPNNFALTIVHLGIGVWGLFAFRAQHTSFLFTRAAAIIFGVLAIFGALPMLNSLLGAIPTFGNTAWVHIVTAVLLVAVVASTWSWPEPAEPELPEPALGVGVVSGASVAGIPVHVFLASFPLAFLLGAVGTDLAHWWTMLDWYADYGGFWATASVWLIGAGLGGAILASLPGLIDAVVVHGTFRRNLLVLHVLGSIGVMVLASINLAIRFREHAEAVIPWGITLSCLTAALLVVSGWYAGHLLHREVISTVSSPENGKPAVQPDSQSVSIASDAQTRPHRRGRHRRRTSEWD